MLDIQVLRDDADAVRRNLNRRGMDATRVDDVIQVDSQWRESLHELNRLRAQRNQAAQQIGQAKKRGEDAGGLLTQMKSVSDRIEELTANVEELDSTRRGLLMRLPNLMHESVPEGPDESANVPVRTWGNAQAHAFEATSHVDLLERLELADIERAAKVAGARFFYLKGHGAILAQAIQRFALDELQARGFTPIDPPYMLRRSAIEGATDLQDFEDVIYKIDGEDLYLVATSEHALGSLHMDEILEAQALPKKYVGVSPCFRKEAGAHGKDTKGIFRVHQFHKVEQFVFCHPDDSWGIHEELLQNAERLVQKLELPYRVVNICTGDLGTVAAKKYDIEAWMPVQGAYRELVSCSNCTDYQARRWNIRTRPSTDAPTIPVHTLNSTALAVERTIVALLENHQQSDGSIRIPNALQPYMGGLSQIGPAPE